MGSFCPHVTVTALLVFLFIAVCLPISDLTGQVPNSFKRLFDTTASLLVNSGHSLKDSISKRNSPQTSFKKLNPFESFKKLIPKKDSTVNDTATIKPLKPNAVLASAARNLVKTILPLDEVRSLLFDDSLARTKLNKLKQDLRSDRTLSVTGGYVNYNFNYRSSIDTPFLETGIYQNQVTGNFDLLLANHLPLTVSYLGRQSNSRYYKNIADVQIAFNSQAFQQGLMSTVRNRLNEHTSKLMDTLSEKLYALKDRQLESIKSRIKRQYSVQRLGEAHEFLDVPGLGYDASLPDSLNKVNADSLQLSAKKYIESYEATMAAYHSLQRQVDSLKDICLENLSRVKRFRKAISDPGSLYQSEDALLALKSEYSLPDSVIPTKYLKLMNVRSASLGRAPLNYSELTAKNITLNGLNFEYNSWYYFAVAAGFVDYRFREFATLNRVKPMTQAFYMLRLGLGKLDKNNIIVSAFRGKKQLFTSRTNPSGLINISGVSLEGRLALAANTYIKGELASSLSPNLRSDEAAGKVQNSILSKNNSAYSIFAYSFIAVTGTRLEGCYKMTGANYQSFSSFQTSSAMESWYIKADQEILNHKVRLSGYLRKNDFSNPFLGLPYNSNTIFKAINFSLRLPRFPVINVGYQPMSQLTAIDNQVFENRFQSLTASSTYSYLIKSLRTTSTLIINKFINDSKDSGFVYYNATNILFTQHFLFSKFTSNIGVNVTKNPLYVLTVLEAGVEPVITPKLSIGIGCRINTINSEKPKLGGFFNANITIFKSDQLTIGYEHGFFPGTQGSLIRNEMGSVQYFKTLKFK